MDALAEAAVRHGRHGADAFVERRQFGRLAVDHGRPAGDLIAERAEHAITSTSVRSAGDRSGRPPAGAHTSTRDLARPRPARREVVRGDAERRAADRVVDRPRRERDQVATVGVAADVPSLVDLGAVATVAERGDGGRGVELARCTPAHDTGGAIIRRDG